ncbi:glutamate receptor ionotropic, kainate glr-3-like isoform X1 [Scylla paramamosain]|uniref:glutamate receptor ionotropic, kainate glr-3-like isoform X1 n=2 Tax=Scylla paramamosain TaxID=85552 RepID=UPI003082CFE7
MRRQLVVLVVVCGVTLSFAQLLQGGTGDSSLMSAPAAALPAPMLRRDTVYHARPLAQGNQALTRPRSLLAVCEAAAQMLSRHLAQCLAVLTSSKGSERGLEVLIPRLDAEGVPRLLLKGPLADNNGTSGKGTVLQEGCVVHVVFLEAAGSGGGTGGRQKGASGWDGQDLYLPSAPVTAPRSHLLILVPFASTDYRRVTTVLLHRHLPLHVDIRLLVPQVSDQGKGPLVNVYRRCLHCQEGDVGVRWAGWWASGGFTDPHTLLREQLRDLHGHVFHSVTMDFAPFIDYDKTQEQPGGVVIPRDSMDIRILQEAARVLNFSFVLREPSDGQWGYLLENGSWTGTVGTVQRGKVDFSMMLSITWERTYAVDFTRAYFVEPMTFVMRKPGPLPQWQAPVKPFSWQVWLMVTVSVLLAGPVIWLVLSLTPYARGYSTEGTAEGKLNGLEEEHESNHGLGLLCLYMVGPIFAEPVPFNPRGSSGRVLCGLWWFFCILTTTLYRGSLIARLTVPTRSSTLDTLEQLAASNLEWGMLDTYGSGYQLFRASQVPVYVSLFKEMQYYNMRHSMERVLKGKYAFISWKTYFRNLIARDYTDRNGDTQVHIAREDFFPGGFGWAFPKNSPYLIKFDKIFQRLIESGVVEKWMDDLIQLSASASKEKQVAGTAAAEVEGPRAFTVYHLQGIFLFTGGGMFLALLALVGEVLMVRFSARTHHSTALSLTNH